MFKVKILGYSKEEVLDYFIFSMDSIIKLRKDIMFLQSELNKKENENIKLMEKVKKLEKNITNRSKVSKSFKSMKERQKYEK